MAVDEAILVCYGEGLVLPTLRLYSWEPPCLSIGYLQSVGKGIDVESCRQRGIALVRRPTGGRALLHEDELTYSLVCALSHPCASGGVVQSYRKISQGILTGLRLLGVEAVALPAPERMVTKTATESCFATTSHYEVTVKGRKLVGSAQLRRDGALLQQGTIPFALDAGKLFCLLKRPGEDPSLWIQRFLGRAISLNEALGRPRQWDEVAQALQAGFEQAFGITFVEGELTGQEEKLARRLEQTKYATPQWNFLR